MCPGILMIGQHLHPLDPLPVQGLLAKSVSCSFMSYLGRGAVKTLGPNQQT